MISRFRRSSVGRWIESRRWNRAAAGWGLGFVVVGAAAAGVWSARAPATAALPVLPAVWVSEAPAGEFWSEDTLRAGATLRGLFRERGVPPEAMAAAVSVLRPVAPPSKLKPGASVRVRRDLWDRVVAVEIRPDPDLRVLVTRVEEAWHSEVEELGVAAETVGVAGVVQRSLYESTLTGGRAPPAGELRRHVLPGLVEIFRWELDFFRDLRGGDRFRVLYERRVRSDGTLRSARVLAAEIVRRSEAHRAVWFHAGDSGDYFDLSGNPMRRAFLKAPIDYRRITSRFSQSRLHPVLGRWRAHLGIDYGAAPGTPVHAVADGVVTHAGLWGSYGRMVELRHANGIGSRYAHLGGIPRGLWPGRSIRQGEVVGWVGSSGLASGPHLHYELRMGGRPVDPRRVNLPAGEPLPDSLRVEFGAARDHLWLVLERGTQRPAPSAEALRSAADPR